MGGISRSATMVVAYLMWSLSISFKAALDMLQGVRPICNPNTAFTCQLLQLEKRLSKGYCPPGPFLLRVVPYHPKELFLLPKPHRLSSLSPPIFDPRFGWILRHEQHLILWLGSRVPDTEAVHVAVLQHAHWLDIFEHCQCTVTTMHEGGEQQELWHALGMPDPPAEGSPLAAPNPA